MRKFIILLSAISVLSFITLLLIKSILIDKSVIQENENILLGDSHVEHVALNKLTNFSTSGAYMKTLYMGLEQIDVNNKRVLVSVGPHSFADFRTTRYAFVSEHSNLLHIMDTLIPRQLNVFHDLWSFPNSGKDLLRILKLYSPKPVYETESNLTDTLLDLTIARHYPSVFVKDSTEMKWFNKIVSYVQENNGELVLLEMPIHNKYWEKIPDTYLVRYDSILSSYENVIRFEKQPDSVFRDGDHILPVYQSSYVEQFLK